MFYYSVDLSGWPIFNCLDVCGSVWLDNLFNAWMFYNSVSVSGWPTFTLLGCSIIVWVCLGDIFFHC